MVKGAREDRTSEKPREGVCEKGSERERERLPREREREPRRAVDVAQGVPLIKGTRTLKCTRTMAGLKYFKIETFHLKYLILKHF